MAPSSKAITEALRKTVKTVFNSNERDDLSVSLIRSKVEDELKLEAGFFKQAEWKQKSKDLVKVHVEELMQAEAATSAISPPKPTPKPVKTKPVKKAAPAPAKKGTKRAAAESKARPGKRQKKIETASDLEDEESELSEGEESSLSEMSDSGADTPKKSKKASNPRTKAPVRQQSKSKAMALSESEEEEEDGISELESEEDSTPKKKKSRSTKSKPKSEDVIDSDEESEDAAPQNKAAEKATNPATSKSTSPKSNKKQALKAEVQKPDDENDLEGDLPQDEIIKADETETRANESDSSEMSVVLDELPPKKRIPKKSGESKARKTSKAKASSSAATKDVSPQEAEMKTLQGQLRKCGVTKIWQFELKQFGDDNNKKIRHLKEMLRDVGMTGRFSETKAAEIKEMRELAADVEAVTQGNESWGTGGRSRRSAGTATRKVVRDDSHEDESEDEAEPEDRTAKVKQDLAFLGDESSSDDD